MVDNRIQIQIEKIPFQNDPNHLQCLLDLTYYALMALFLLMGNAASAALPTQKGNVHDEDKAGNPVAHVLQQSGKHIVKGVVVDKMQETVIGASVVVPNTTIGCITNIDGEFALEVDQLPVTL